MAVSVKNPTRSSSTLTERSSRPTLVGMKVREAVAHFGSLSKLAKSLGLTRQGVYDWRRQQRVGNALEAEIPWTYACRLEIVTQGALKAGPAPTSPSEKV